MQSSSLHHEYIPIEEKKKSYQFKALLYKSLSYQKKQFCTNIFCIGLCPFFIVFISSLIGVIVNYIFNPSSKSRLSFEMIALIKSVIDVLYCSAVPAMDDNLWPLSLKESLPKTTDVPGTFGMDTAHYNKFLLTPEQDNSLTLQSLFFPKEVFCVHWFGQSFRRSSKSKNVNVSDWDTSFLMIPRDGWLQVISNVSYPNRFKLLNDLNEVEMRPWAIYGASSKKVLDLLPERPKLDQIKNISLIVNRESLVDINETSFFYKIETRFHTNWSASERVEFQPVPYFQKLDHFKSPSHMDETIATLLENTIHELSIMNKSLLFQWNPSEADKASYNTRVDRIIQKMPYGGIWFDTLDHTQLKYKYTLQFGTDIRLKLARGFPDTGKRLFLQQAQLSNAIFQSAQSNLTKTADDPIVISHGTRIFPQLSRDKEFPISGMIGSILFPFGLSFLLPLFTVTLVKEKESKFLIMMQMNGVKLSINILCHYITFFLLYLLSAASFIITGFLAKMSFFTRTDIAVVITVLYIWGHSLVTMAFFFSAFFTRSGRALVIVFLVVFCGILVNIVFDNYFTYIPAWATYLWPPITFYRALYIVNVASYNTNYTPYTYSRLQSGDEVYTCLLVMYAQVTILLGFSGYLYYVIPSEYGVRRPWYYAIYRVYRQVLGIRKKRKLSMNMKSMDMRSHLLTLRQQIEDDSVDQERNQVFQTSSLDPEVPVIIKNIRKVYSDVDLGDKVAINNVSFQVKKGTVFGLLGTNGAGKSSLISILTGLKEATSGSARLAGFNLQKETKHIYRNIGICPQFNILWDTLTVKEHLLFYARIKGIESKNEDKVVKECLRTVCLEDFEHDLAGSLSNGDQRRLAIAIALVGDPKVIFLDEPTNGLDPINKRLIWNIIHSVKKTRAIVMTTHSMEEAEVCCQKLGIMSEGSLLTIGSFLELQHRYGSGYQLLLEIDPQHSLLAHEFIESLLPCQKKQSQAPSHLIKYEFKINAQDLADIFQEMIQHSHDYGVVNWKLSQTSLEDVFINILNN